MPSVSTILSSSTYTHPYTQSAEIHLRRQVTSKSILKQHLKQQQKIQQKKTLPLFPTERTRGSSSIQNALKPVDIAQIELMPIEFSHRIIMSCIDEIKLRGLKHKYLFRNAFYSPSVEAALTLLMDPKRSHLFSVKMMRMDTIGGLLTTALSRTYPPLIPSHVHESFQSPNGKSTTAKRRLLGLLPELNRFLFVEILDLCCDLVDHQLDNCISFSKLAIYPGSCCFGLDEYMPTWDTRYLMTKDRKKFSGAFYHIIYAYRDERDLSAEDLQRKIDNRERILQRERLDTLEKVHGLKGALAILRMEARIAQGLPAESPLVQSHASDGGLEMKEISLYVDRQEKVVADDAISVLDIHMDEGYNYNNSDMSVIPNLGNVFKKAAGDTQQMLADLKRNVSVATLAYSSESSNSNRLQCLGTPLSAAATATSIILSASSSSSTIASSKPKQSTTYRPAAPPSPSRPQREMKNAIRTKSLARFGSIAQNMYPVSPGDIFGISRHAKEQRELQGFLMIARAFKSSRRKPKSMASKRITQWRLYNKLIHHNIRTAPLSQRLHRSSQGNHHTYGAHFATTGTTSLRRDRTRRFRQEIEIYLARGLSAEQAAQEHRLDSKKRRQKEKKARLAARKLAEIEAVAVKDGKTRDGDVTMEETEILEAMDYLSDLEFKEFMVLAGLTHEDVHRIREKAAAAALSQVTKDIQSGDEVQRWTSASLRARPPSLKGLNQEGVLSKEHSTASSSSAIRTFDCTGSDEELKDTQERKQRPLSLPHMTSMDLLLKHATMIGDGNLRCYPTRPPSPVNNERSHDLIVTENMNGISHGGLLSHAAASLIAEDKEATERKSEESNASSTGTAVESSVDMQPVSCLSSYSEVTPTVVDAHVVSKLEGPPAAPERIFQFEMVYEDEDQVSDIEELQFLEVDAETDVDPQQFPGVEDDEAQELRDLLESMTEEERLEFFRLSRQDALSPTLLPFGAVVDGI
ncbi:hypothetical protein BGX28_006015 [Mortierella sp. GBA30]|nr:hypothetical protein BGX28_006015 [Mortierella sp. GBA30]